MNFGKIRPFVFIFSLLCCFFAHSQPANRVVVEQCGTMPRLQQRLSQNPLLKQNFETQRNLLARMLSLRNLSQERGLREQDVLRIPVVFHIVLTNPALITNAQIQAQLDTLNKEFSGTNGDAFKVPSYFQPLVGKSRIQFCLAQRTPDGDPTTGIVRVNTTRASFSTDDAVKRTATGGQDSWNTDQYYNVWICLLSQGVLGYATLPDDGAPNEQGVVIDYRSLPGGSATNYNGGKTLTHETGHYFNLYHIWGDDDGLCTGSDDVDDTPNQGKETTGCYSGVRTDNCSTSGNGIMYQNYMDYSYDACLVMFTAQQVTRMENALLLYRSSLLTSPGCQPVVRKNLDAQLREINNPSQRLCSAAFSPVVTIKNNGVQTLTALTISTQIDNGPITTTTWNGSLASSATAVVNLTGLSTPVGQHQLTVYTSRPNGGTDEDLSNDTLRVNYQYYEPVQTVSESFEGGQFPPLAWDVVNPDGGLTWQPATGIAKTGNMSVVIQNFDYSALGQKDDLRLPQVSLPAGVDSAFISFQVAAAAFTAANTQGNVWDTLEVLVSTDCGQNYTSLYRKWGSSLVTRTGETTSEFVPTQSEWRKDSINLGAYIGQSNLLLAFRNTTGNENNIYLDDVNVRTVTVNPNLKASGFLVTPSPTSGQINVQFYPQPANLRAIQVFNAAGQTLAAVSVAAGQASNLYLFNLTAQPAGVYFVRAVFTDRVVTKKIVKF